MNVNKQMPITPKQKRVLDFLNRFIVKNGYSPSLNEIARYLSKSIGTVQHFVEELEIRGYLQKRENVARSLISTGEATQQVFKLGYIAAGEPIEPIQNPEPIDIPASFIKSNGNYYALQVKGESMIEDAILDGDTIIVRHQQTAEDGDRVVAVTEDGATLKVFRKRDGKIYLEPRNKNLKLLYPKELVIRGKFCGLIRRED